jgi:hypothetical protein
VAESFLSLEALKESTANRFVTGNQFINVCMLANIFKRQKARQGRFL